MKMLEWVESVCQSVILGSSVEATVHSFSNSFSTTNFICNTLSVRGNVFNLFSVSMKLEFLVVVTDNYRLLWHNSLSLVYTCPYFLGNWCSGCNSIRSAGPCGLKMKALWSFKILWMNYLPTLLNISEELNFQIIMFLLVGRICVKPQTSRIWDWLCYGAQWSVSALCYHLKKATEWLSDLCLVSRTSVKNILEHGCHKPSELECF